jgi:hypothetical protein
VDDIFAPVDLPDNDDLDKDYLSELVGDDKQFKTVQDLAKSKVHANRHIKTLEEKLDELRKELETRTKMDDFMTEVKKVLPGQVPNQPQTSVTPDVKNDGGLDDSTLEQKLEALLAQREQKTKTESNINKVQRVMKENFGDDANLVINKKAQDLGMSPKALQQIAVESPTAFFNLVGAQEVVERDNPPVVPRSGVNPGNSGYSPVRNAAFYEKMKRENPKLYFDSKTTVTMIMDRQVLGDKFYS